MTAMSPDGSLDNLQHQQAFLQGCATWPEQALFSRAARLFHWALQNYMSVSSDALLPNDTAAAACFGRCFWQLRGALAMAEQGLNAEARNLLRSAYESAGLGRILARDAADAEDWRANPKRWPHRRVRRWIDESEHIPDAAGQDYADFYRLASAWAHPTAESCMPVMIDDGTSVSPSVRITFDEDASRQAVLEITLATVFTCFAIKNALIDETVVDPRWFEDLVGLARELTGEPLQHLNRDWEAERAKFDEFVRRIHSAGDAQVVLANHPQSFQNLAKTEQADQ